MNIAAVILSFAAVTIVSLASSHVKAQAIVSADSVVVSARAMSDISPGQTLSGNELERLSTNSVADAMRYFAGVQIKDYGGVGGLKTVNIRSMGTHHTGVFYDGIQVGNAQNGVVDLGRFSLDNTEAVSLYNGQKSSIFQPAGHFSSASAIYIQTRRPTFDGARRDNLRLTVKGGSFKTIDPSILWEHRFGKGSSRGNGGVKMSLSAEYLYTSGEYKFRYSKLDGYRQTAVRRNGDVRLARIEAALFGEIPRGEWTAKVYFYDSKRGYPGAAVREEPGKFSHEDRQWDTDLFAQGSVRKSFGSVYELMVNGKYAYDYLHYRSDPRLDVSTMWVDNHYRQHEAYLSAANLFRIFDRWSVDVSLDARWNALDADLYGFVGPRRLTVMSVAATSVKLGRVSMQASLLHTFVDDTLSEKTASTSTSTSTSRPESTSRLAPAVIVNWRPLRSADLDLRAFYKRIFRMPTFGDLYYTFIGRSELRPEFTTQYDIGATYSLKSAGGRWTARVDAYYNEVENKIVAVPTSNQFRWTMINFGFVKIAGVDASLRYDVALGRTGVNASVNYNFQRAGDFTDPKSPFYGDQIPYIPWHSGSATVGATRWGWNLTYSFIYTGERYEQAANIPENHAEPFYTHDVSLSGDIALGHCTMRVGAQINNLLNQQYEVVACYPMPGINFKLIFGITL